MCNLSSGHVSKISEVNAFDMKVQDLVQKIENGLHWSDRNSPIDRSSGTQIRLSIPTVLLFPLGIGSEADKMNCSREKTLASKGLI